MYPPSLNFLIIGAGSRGTAYGRAVTAITNNSSTKFQTPGGPIPRIAAVAEPDRFKRTEFGRSFIWGKQGQSKPGQEFIGWKEWIAWEDARRRRAAGDVVGLAGTGGEVDVDVDDELNQVGADVVITGVFVCTLDDSHAEILLALAHLELHVLCEKPLALSLEDCLSIQDAYSSTGSGDRDNSGNNNNNKNNNNIHDNIHGRSHLQRPKQQKIFSIGHVLRYSPHNTLLRRLLLQDKVIGDVISLEHTEPVGWWHFAHSYVRGNWRHTTPEGVGTLLTKSCHDIDFILWMLSSPPDPTDALATPHLPSMISSTGSLSHFRRARKPKQAGKATNCTECVLGEQGCAFSAKNIYRDRILRQEWGTDWPLNIVVPEIEDIVTSGGGKGWEAAESALLDKLAEDYDATDPADVAAKRVKDRSWYGRCVYESDNNVVDDQTVTITWDEEDEPPRRNHHHHPDGSSSGHLTRGPKTAIFHLSFATQAQCERRGRIYGSHGEIAYDSKRITVYTFTAGDHGVVVHTLDEPTSAIESNHGGGDLGLARSFVDAVRAVDSGDMDAPHAQRRFIGGDLDEIVRSHAVVFAAEHARKHARSLNFSDWLVAQKSRFPAISSPKYRHLNPHSFSR